MTNISPECPSQDKLSELVHGRLSNQESELIEEHMLECDRCALLADTLSGGEDITSALLAPPVIQSTPEEEIAINKIIEQGKKLLVAPLPEDKPDTRTVETVNVNSSQDESIEKTMLSGMGQADGSDSTRLDLNFLAPAQSEHELGQLGGYHILEVLGQGGMGMVLKAKDPDLQRIVALKVMKPQLSADQDARERFLQEARAAAAIDDDNIVQIFQVGEDQNVAFIAMQFLLGESLNDRIKREGQLSQAEILRIGRETAQGLAAAHARGLIHRDIKPDNIWLQAGQDRVKIVDFGLVRSSEQDVALTQTGAILGTPRYMAPEQAQGQSVDHQADLFSLGSVLYQLAAGEPAFARSNLTSTLIAVAHEDPAPLQELHETLDLRLCDLIMNLLSKDPEQRPQSAQEVCERIAEIEADPQPRVIPKQKKVRRPKSAAPQTNNSRGSGSKTGAWVVLGTLGAAFLLGVIIITIKNKDGTETQIKVPDGASVEIEKDGTVVGGYRPKNDSEPDNSNRSATMSTAESVSAPISQTAFSTLKQSDIPEAQREMAGFSDPSAVPAEVVAIWGEGRGRSLGTIWQMQVSPDGRLLATASGANSVNLWESKSLLPLQTFSDPWHVPAKITFASNGERLITSDVYNSRPIRVYNIGERRLEQVLTNDGPKVSTMQYIPDREILLSGHYGGGVGEWNLDTGERIGGLTPPHETNEASAVAFDPQGQMVAIVRSGDSAGLELRQLDGGEIIHTWPVMVAKSSSRVVFSSDGKLLAAISREDQTKNYTLRVWDTETGQEVGSLPDCPECKLVIFDASGDIALISSDYICRFSMESGVRFTIEKDLNCNAASFAPDQKTLLVGREHGRMTPIDWATGEILQEEADLAESYIKWAVVNQDGSRIAIGYSNPLRRIEIHDVQTNQILQTVSVDIEPQCMAYLPSGDLVVRQWEQPIEMLRRSAEQFDETFAENSQKISRRYMSFAVDRSGERIASWIGPELIMQDSNDGNILWKQPFSRFVISIDFSPDGNFIATSHYNSSDLERGVTIRDASDGSLVQHLPTHGSGWHHGNACFSPDGRYLAVGDDGGFMLWTSNAGWAEPVADPQYVHYPEKGNRLHSLSFSPDSRYIAGRNDYGTLFLWEMSDTETPLLVMRRSPEDLFGGTRHVSFTPDGRHLLVVTYNGMVYALRIPTWNAQPIDPDSTGLYFNGKDSQLDLPFSLEDLDEFTVEAYVHPYPNTDVNALLHQPKGFMIFTDGSILKYDIAGKRGSIGRSLTNQPVHFALTCTDKTSAIFLNGQRVAITVSDVDWRNNVKNLESGDRNMRIGYAKPNEGPFRGVIDEVRVSNSIRYTESFVPERQFETDDNTFALYHFDEGEGDVLKDSSGNDHHGKIVSGNWVKVDDDLKLNEPLKEPLSASSKPNRRAAEWVLSIGGKLHVIANNKEVHVNRLEDLPKEPFFVIRILLEHNQIITDAGLKHIESFKQLQKLNLEGTRITDAGLKYIESNQQLTGLALTATSITDAGLKHVAVLKQLDQLSLWGTKVTGNGLKHLLPLKKLYLLNLQDTEIGDDSLLILKDLSLTHLNINDSLVTDVGLKYLESMKQLKNLYLQETKVTPQAIAELQKVLPNCKIVSDFDSPVTDREIAEWVLSIGDRFTHVLVIANNKKVDVDRPSGNRTKDFPREPFFVRDIVLEHNRKVTDDGLQHLAKLEKLTLLNLKYTEITDVGLKHLDSLKKLQTLELQNTKVTPQGITELQKALPNCNIISDFGTQPPATKAP